MLIRLASENDKWVITRDTTIQNIDTKKKKTNPAAMREFALSEVLARLGESKDWNQRANNAFVYYILPTFTSFGMAFEKRMNQLIGSISAIITECSCKDECKNHVGRSVLIEGGIFENTNTLTEWFMNFFQQSVSINGLARKDQVEVAKAGYATATVPTWSPFGKEEKEAEAD